jgi:uncharacterized protein (DUF697 family)
MHNLSNQNLHSEFESAIAGYELSPEFETYSEFEGEAAYDRSPECEFEDIKFENSEAELSEELMQISNEADFGDWLKKVAKKGAGIASNFLDSSAGQQATSVLGNIASKTIPGVLSKTASAVGAKVGGVIGRSGLGAQIGSQIGSKAAQYAADKANSFVKLATDSIGNMTKEFESGFIPDVKQAIAKAASRHYPSILKAKRAWDQFQSNGTSSEGDITHNEGTFNEVTEMELASELLSVQSEAELDQFLGNLFQKATGAIKNFAKSGTGQALGGMLKGLAKKALPVVGGAVGSFLAPGIGTGIGTALGSAAGNLFELELEGLSAEDREFETAKAFVRFAGNAARRASTTKGKQPAQTAKSAIVSSAKRYAPGILARDQMTNANTGNGNGNGNGHSSEEGSWYREGNRIIIEGV